MVISPLGLLVFGVTMVISLWAQAKVKGAYARNSQIPTRSGMTGADIARWMMQKENIVDVGLEPVGGELTDHYDPKARVVRLSEGVYNSGSIAALGIAAHEIGHVIQHAHGYAPMHVRSVVYPVASFGSKLALPLILAGVFISTMPYLLWAGILLFAASTLFTVITLPVEFNASSRAMHALEHGNILEPDELTGAKQVLDAAALTYVAAAVASVLWLLYYIMLARGRG